MHFNCSTSCSSLFDGSCGDERDALLQNHASLNIGTGGGLLDVLRSVSIEWIFRYLYLTEQRMVIKMEAPNDDDHGSSRLDRVRR
jgi:hypothetical protein